VTKEEFLSNPVGHYFGMKPFPDIPDEWFREAWDTSSTFREAMIHYCAEHVKKSGSIRFPINVGSLSSCLTAEQAVQLYEGLRDGADRCESEWRVEFQEDFPQCADRLPPINRVAVCDCLTQGLVFGMKHKNFPYIRRMLAEFKLWEISLNEAKLSAGVIWGNFQCFAEIGEEDTISILRVAEAEGMTEVVALLREAGATE
jgi:hypothetical protein